MKIRPAQALDKIAIDVSEWNENAKAFLKAFNSFEVLVFNDLALIYYNRERPAEERFDAAFDAAALALVDEQGAPLLSEEDREAVKGASFEPIARLFSTVFAKRDAEKIETVKKN